MSICGKRVGVWEGYVNTSSAKANAAFLKKLATKIDNNVN